VADHEPLGQAQLLRLGSGDRAKIKQIARLRTITVMPHFLGDDLCRRLDPNQPPR